MKNDLRLSREPHPEFNVGDKFLVVESTPFAKKGGIAILVKNDGSWCPFFNVDSQNKLDVAISWSDLTPFVEDKKQEQPKAESAKKDKFEVGDIVEVVDNGARYTTYSEWFNKADPNLKARYRTYGVNFPKNGDVVKIVAKHPHGREYSRMLYAVERGDKIGLISGGGIKQRGYKVGDTVEIVDDSKLCGYNVGDTATIVSDPSSVSAEPLLSLEMYDRGSQVAIAKRIRPCETKAEQPPKKHAYTPEQIQEARDIVYRLLTSTDALSAIYMYSFKCSILDKADVPNIGKPHTVSVWLSNRNQPFNCFIEKKRAVAFCSPGDEWNDDIGRMVALCKLLNKPLPKWIYSNKGGTK